MEFCDAFDEITGNKCEKILKIILTGDFNINDRAKTLHLKTEYKRL